MVLGILNKSSLYTHVTMSIIIDQDITGCTALLESKPNAESFVLSPNEIPSPRPFSQSIVDQGVFI